MRKKRYKHSEITKNKIRESNLRYWETHSRKGRNNGFFSKKHTEKTKKKISQSKYHKNLKARHNPNFGNGEKLKGNKNPMKRKEVSKKVSQWRKTNQFGKKNPFFNKKHTDKSKQKMRTTPRKHHIYLIENSSEIIYLAPSKHRQLHARAYNYIYDKYGKRGINDYLKWFDKTYGLIESLKWKRSQTMIRAKNKFYKQLKLDKKTAKAVNFYRQIKESMLKDEYRAKNKNRRI